MQDLYPRPVNRSDPRNSLGSRERHTVCAARVTRRNNSSFTRRAIRVEIVELDDSGGNVGRRSGLRDREDRPAEDKRSGDESERFHDVNSYGYWLMVVRSGNACCPR